MRLAAKSPWRTSFLIGALLVMPGTAATAGSDGVFEESRDTSSREILLSFGSDDPPESSFRDHIRFSKKRGIEYNRVITTDEQTLFLRLYGPVIKKKPGLGFELKGLEVGDFKVRVKGYGSTKKANLAVRVTF